MRILKKTILCFALNAVLYSLLTNTVLAWSSGPPAYRTGAPNDSGTCNADGCHNTYSLDSGNATFSIKAPATYKPGKMVKIKVSFTNSSGKLHGFQMTAVDANGERVGKFKKIGNTNQVIPPNDHRGLESADKNKYIEHTSKGIKKKIWKLKWKAPRNAADPITFYAAGIEANGDGIPNNDYVYTATLETNAVSSTP